MENQGGKRKGAGRPKGTTKENKKIYKTFSVSCLESEEAEIKRLAESSGKTVSRYLVDLALGKQRKTASNGGFLLFLTTKSDFGEYFSLQYV